METGVTLQTLDPKSFDHGIILAQRRYTIPNSHECTYEKLVSFITPKAADLLVQGIRERLFVPPLIDVRSPTARDEDIKHAPTSKITANMKQIDWETWKMDEVDRRIRALGSLWTEVEYPNQKAKRWLFSEIEYPSGIRPPLTFSNWKELITRHTGNVPEIHFCTFNSPGNVVRRYVEDGDGIIIEMCDEGTMRVNCITTAGKEKRPAKMVMTELREMWQEVDRGKFWDSSPV